MGDGKERKMNKNNEKIELKKEKKVGEIANLMSHVLRVRDLWRKSRPQCIDQTQS